MVFEEPIFLVNMGSVSMQLYYILYVETKYHWLVFRTPHQEISIDDRVWELSERRVENCLGPVFGFGWSSIRLFLEIYDI